MVQELMAYNTENPTSEQVGELLAKVKEKLAALESNDSQENTDSSGDK
jgi:hypothetical protein